MFAAAYGTNAIYVYNFYTGEAPTYYQCKGHVNKVRCIDWSEDDMSFTSCAMDGNSYHYDLMTYKDIGQRVGDRDFNQKGVMMTSVVNIPGKPGEIFVVGNDRKIWHSRDAKNAFDAGTVISQICLSQNQRTLFAGCGEENKPGAIKLFNNPLGYLTEVQAHAKPVERMRLSFDGNFLFSAGQDGLMIIHDIKNQKKDDISSKGNDKKDSKHDDNKGLPFSDEILT